MTCEDPGMLDINTGQPLQTDVGKLCLGNMNFN